jgi:hypothetical protein
VKHVYPFQVPAVSTTAAQRDAIPRDNFRVTTADVDDQQSAGAAQANQLGQPGVPASDMAQGAVRAAGEATEGPEL